MATLLENLELGLAGAEDEILGGHRAADVYAQQEAANQGKTVAQLDTQARAAEDAGAVDAAAQATLEQGKDAVKGLADFTKWIVVGIVAVAGIVALVQLGPVIKRLA